MTTPGESAQELRPGGRRRWRWAVAALGVAVLGAVVAWSWPTAAEREADRWIQDFAAVRAKGIGRLPDWPLSYEGQCVLVRSFTRPESPVIRVLDRLRRALPPSLRPMVPRLPGARTRAMTLGPALIEMPKMPAIRKALLEAAIDPRGANRVFAIQFAGGDWPVPRILFPLLERLADDADPAVRSQVALALTGIPPGDPAVERLIARMQSDQVSTVREAARSSYRSSPDGERVPWPSDHATRP